jgi:hypothetical protein
VSAASEITFRIPPPAASPFHFRRALLNAIRTAISQAHVHGELDTETVVRCLGALPMPMDSK